MTDIRDGADMSDEDLKRSRDLGGATYLSAYVRLRARELGVNQEDFLGLREVALKMLPAINLATEAAWCATMTDRAGVKEKMKALETELHKMVNT